MPQITSILVSVFGGLTRVDRVASTFIDLLAGTPVELPLTFRLMGTNLREADDILASAGLDNHHRLEAAVDAAVRSGQRSREVAP
jgi:succinyl-CoA synthetase beta subunit